MLEAREVGLFGRARRDFCALKKRAFPVSEQEPFVVLLALSALGKGRMYSFYEGDTFCGMLSTLPSDELVFVLYLAVNDEIRSRGYGSRILRWVLEDAGEREVVLNVEKPDEEAHNQAQRLRRIAFYEKCGLRMTGCEIRAGEVTYSVMSSRVDDFDELRYRKHLRDATLGYFRA